MKKRLIALMLGATMVATALTGCGKGKSQDEIRNENEIRELLEYEANINISKYDIQNNGFKIEYKIENEKFYVTFISQRVKSAGRVSYHEDVVRITYQIDKETYYDLKNNYSSHESQHEVEKIKALVDAYDPIDVKIADKEMSVVQ